MVKKSKVSHGKPSRARLPILWAGSDSKAWSNEFNRWFLTIISALLAFGVIAFLIVTFYHPDIQKAVDTAKRVALFYAPNLFSPEPVERILYLSAVLTLPLLLAGFYFIYGKLFGAVKPKFYQYLFPAEIVIAVILLITLAWLGLHAANPFGNESQSPQDDFAKTNVKFYFLGTFLYNYFYWYLLVVFPLVFALFLLRINSLQKLNITPGAKNILLYIPVLVLLLCLFLITSFSFPYSYENKYNFNAVYYSVVQVFRGTPMLVDRFTNTYGLYPHFIVPFLKITGLSVLSFSSLMAILVVLCFGMIFLFLKKAVKNRLLVLFGFSTIYYTSYLYSGLLGHYDPYYAMVPIRWLYPCLLMVYSVFYLRSRSKILYFISFPFFATGILWNPDFGLITFVSLLIFYCYLELTKPSFKIIILNICKHILVAGSSVLLVFFGYILIIRIFYGNYPDLSLMFSTLQMFALIGANMLPMPGTWHPWMVIALIYMIGILYALAPVFRREITTRQSLVLLLTVLGSGLFAYYTGRSHNWNLLSCSPMAIMLLTIYADDLLELTRKNKFFTPLLALVIFALAFSVFQIIHDYNYIVLTMYDKENKKTYEQEQIDIMRNAAFIRTISKPGEKMLILTRDYRQGLYYSMSTTTAPVNPGLLDLFFKYDHYRILAYLLKNSADKVIFEPAQLLLRTFEIPAMLAACYNVQAVQNDTGRIWVLEKRKVKPQGPCLLPSRPGDVVRENFDSCPSRYPAYVFGHMGGLKLGPCFSVEILFKPDVVPHSKFTNRACLLSNKKDHDGFVIEQVEKSTTDYAFVIGTNGALFKAVPGQWNYLAVDVDQKVIRIFINGKLMNSFLAPSGYLESSNPLYIGNYNLEGNLFFGNIREIRISSAPMDPARASLTWEQVRGLDEILAKK